MFVGGAGEGWFIGVEEEEEEVEEEEELAQRDGGLRLAGQAGREKFFWTDEELEDTLHS